MHSNILITFLLLGKYLVKATAAGANVGQPTPLDQSQSQPQGQVQSTPVSCQNPCNNINGQYNPANGFGNMLNNGIPCNNTPFMPLNSPYNMGCPHPQSPINPIEATVTSIVSATPQAIPLNPQYNQPNGLQPCAPGNQQGMQPCLPTNATPGANGTNPHSPQSNDPTQQPSAPSQISPNACVNNGTNQGQGQQPCVDPRLLGPQPQVCQDSNGNVYPIGSGACLPQQPGTYQPGNTQPGNFQPGVLPQTPTNCLFADCANAGSASYNGPTVTIGSVEVPAMKGFKYYPNSCAETADRMNPCN